MDTNTVWAILIVTVGIVSIAKAIINRNKKISQENTNAGIKYKEE